ncbi:MAG: DUF192 domain-containing protein [Verrucomicrobiota bacterium]
MRFPLILTLFAFAALGSTGCTPGSEPRVQTEVADKSTRFPIALGTKTCFLELALNNSERQKGLMFRQSLDTDHGMLFIFDRSRRQDFWMRNTPLPLDIGYFDASGTLIEVHQLYPYDETAVSSRSQQILIALEMSQGWFSQNKIKPGAQLDMSALSDAITLRGFDPDRFPLQ